MTPLDNPKGIIILMIILYTIAHVRSRGMTIFGKKIIGE